MALTDQAAALDVRYPARPSQVALIRQAVGDVASEFGASEAVLLQINLAVSEAATNAIVHAYRDRAEDEAGEVRVIVRPCFDGLLAVHVSDEGIGLIPRTDSPGMGLGLCLMAHETECFEVRKAPAGGTEVVLSFRL
jgi:anti-sigma regulatory factor (Ser/Thr protein kinase)